MKKLLVCKTVGNIFYRDLKINLSFLAFLFSVFSVSANYDGQGEKISIDVSNTPLEEVFHEIEESTDFSFFYENSAINLERNVSIRVSDLDLEEVLKMLLEDSDILFSINNKQIILKPRDLPDTKRPREAVKQQQQISGRIVDENGIPLLGATVVVKGTSIGTTADYDGNYQIEVPSGASTLVVSYVGYQTQEVEIGSETTIDVVMSPANDSLDEVVVVGYGTSRKEDIVGSVGVVDMENIAAQSPTVNLDNALQGQIAGVQVTNTNGQPGSPARIRIRGTTSLRGSNQPLYVIDGIPVVAQSNIPVGGTEGGNLGNEIAQQGLNTPIGNINPNDIASISVLKDASAGAIYGSRAANGVIIINTKQGTFSSAPRFNADVSFSTQEARTLDVLNAEQFREATITAVENGTVDNAYTRSVLDGSYFGDADTNWEDELSPSNPMTTNYNLNVQGGTESTRYFSALGYQDQQGVYEGTGFDRYTFKVNLDTELSSIWSMGVRSNISFSDQQALDGAVTDRMYVFRPDVPVFDEDGNYSTSSMYNLENPVALAQATNENKTFLMLSSVYTELELAEGLSARTLLSINYNNGRQNSFYPRYTLTGGWSSYSGMGDGYAQESRTTGTNLMWENTLRYGKMFQDVHRIDAVLGASFEQNNSAMVKAWGTGYFNDVLTNITSATVERDGSSLETASGLASYFGRFNYELNNRYLASLSARVDGSSKFAVENKYAFFPAVAAGWRISEESFLADIDEISEIKLRSSWGITGQQDFGPYQWRTLYETDDYGGAPSIVLTQLGNDRLKWERTTQFDLGIDYSFFDDRLRGGIGYYSKDTEDAIFTVTTPGNIGFSTAIANVGRTRNEGIEFELSADIIRNEDFNWRLTVNASKNRNELVSVNDDFKDEEGYISGFGGGGTLREGSPIGLIYGYVSEEIFQTQEEIDALNEASPTGVYQYAGTAPGDLKREDISGPEGVPDGVVNTYDQTIIGDTQPDFFGGFSNVLRYKGFTLTALFNYSVGNDVHWFNQSRSINFSSTYQGENKTVDVFNAWTPENPTDMPRMVYGDPNYNNRTSSYYVYDASYLRLKTLNLQYTLSPSALERWNFLNSASIFVVGQNLLTITDYPGADPEATNLYNNDISAGRDNNRFPVAKVFTAGVRIGF